MRLIDADKLVGELNNHYLVVGAEGNPEDSVARNERLYADIQIVNEQSTAYDVKKVLEQHGKPLEDMITECFGKYSPGNYEKVVKIVASLSFMGIIPRHEADRIISKLDEIDSAEE